MELEQKIIAKYLVEQCMDRMEPLSTIVNDINPKINRDDLEFKVENAMRLITYQTNTLVELYKLLDK